MADFDPTFLGMDPLLCNPTLARRLELERVRRMPAVPPPSPDGVIVAPIRPAAANGAPANGAGNHHRHAAPAGRKRLSARP
jgi:hypothetical protein